MATIDMATWDGDGVNSPTLASGAHRAFVIGREIDLAAAVTAKGSALAQADVIQALNIPAGVMVIGGLAKKTTAMTGTSTDLTFDIGITGVDADVLVDGWDYDNATVGTYATPVGVQIGTGASTSARTIDILLATQTGTVTGGKVYVSAVCVDVNRINRPGIAAPQS